MSASAEKERVNASESRGKIKNKDPSSCLRGSPVEWTIHHECHPQHIIRNTSPTRSPAISAVRLDKNAESALMDLDESFEVRNEFRDGKVKNASYVNGTLFGITLFILLLVYN